MIPEIFYLVFTSYPSGVGTSDPVDWQTAATLYEDSRAQGYDARVCFLAHGAYADCTESADNAIRLKYEQARERPPLWMAADPLDEQRLREDEDRRIAEDETAQWAALRVAQGGGA